MPNIKNYFTFIALLFICYFNLLFSKYIKRGYYEKQLNWKNEKIDLKIIKKEIINYQKNLSISFENFESVENPKISLIIPVYNQQKYLNKFYISIKNQSLKQIEIIFVDDASTDNSSEIIKEFMKKDKRIIYLKNDINRRTFYSRKRGVLNSKGEYVLIIDPDDLLLNNILEKSYETAKYYNLDILQFYIIIGSYQKNNVWKNLKCKSGIVYYPKIKDFFYQCRPPNLWDKLIKREIFIKSINFMGENYNYDRFEVHDDDLAIFGLLKMAKSYGFLEQIGYFYNCYNPNSTTRQSFKIKNVDKIFKTLFTIMKYFFEKSNNTRKDKLLAYKFFYKKVFRNFRGKIKFLNKDFNYIDEILQQYLNCRYFKKDEKENIKNFLNEIRKVKLKKNKI